jgi:hypothetical protein
MVCLWEVGDHNSDFIQFFQSLSDKVLQLRAALLDIRGKFVSFTHCVQESLIKKGVNLDGLRSEIGKHLGRSDDNRVLPDHADEVKRVIVNVLKSTTILNHYIFKKFCEVYKLNNYEDALENYVTNLENVLKNYSILDYINQNANELFETKGDREELVIESSISPEEALERLIAMHEDLAKILDLDLSSISMSRVDIGSVRVTFLIPTKIAENIFRDLEATFSKQQIEDFRSASIEKLEYKNHAFDFTERGEILVLHPYILCLVQIRDKK